MATVTKQQDGNRKKEEEMEEKKERERVLEPKEVDILCGRGGLSNHHPGNEWYRCLIRSNRPLYRACPKHTKLLVSKAIVQAVQQQGGRFLERSRKDGFWYSVSYKRSVDKTSQGLRERDRDEDLNQPPVAVPHQFSGRGSHALSDLADVAIATATRAEGLPRHPSGLVPNNAAAAAAAAAKLKVFNVKPPVRKPPAPSERPSAPSVPTARSVAARKLPSSSRPLPHKSAMASVGGQVPIAPAGMPRTAAAPLPSPAKLSPPNGNHGHGIAPRPPPFETRQSSMMRLLKETKLLPGESTWFSTPSTTPTHASQIGNSFGIPSGGVPASASGSAAASYSNGYNNPHAPHNNGMNGTASVFTQMERNIASAFPTAPVDAVRAAAWYGFQQGLDAAKKGEVDTAAFQKAVSHENAFPPAQGNAPAPALTRLTSQVSDWLNSFWPVPARDGEEVAAAPVAAAPTAAANLAATQNSFMSTGTAATASKPSGEQYDFSAAERQFATAIITVPPPQPPPELRIKFFPPPKHPPSKAKETNGSTAKSKKKGSLAKSSNQEDGKEKEVREEPSPPPMEAAQPSITLLSSASIGVDAGPTDLEHSASATLLKLAGSSSKFFSGISSLFGDAPVRKKGDGPERVVEVATDVDPPIAGTKRSKASLLDDNDDDDDDEEDRRQLFVKRQKPSLLEDYEESPVETRMRFV